MKKRKKKVAIPDVVNYDELQELGSTDSNGVAYEYGREKVTYSRLLAKVNRVAKGFKNAGIRSGERVIVCLPGIPQQIECMYAMSKNNIESCVLHPDTKAPAIAVMAENLACKAIITTDDHYEKIAKAIAGLDHPVQIILADVDVRSRRRKKRKLSKYAKDEHVTIWSDFVKRR